MCTPLPVSMTVSTSSIRHSPLDLVVDDGGGGHGHGRPRHGGQDEGYVESSEARAGDQIVRQDLRSRPQVSVEPPDATVRRDCVRFRV